MKQSRLIDEGNLRRREKSIHYSSVMNHRTPRRCTAEPEGATRFRREREREVLRI